VKLLLDQNLSRRLLPELERVFPGSSHVQMLGLDTALDQEVWQFAEAGEYAIVTKDADFVEMSALRGHPPKIIWLNLGNVPNRTLVARFLGGVEANQAFLETAADGVLQIE
jgi:predicted nuclease of predicted toxin-antitoxin system